MVVGQCNVRNGQAVDISNSNCRECDDWLCYSLSHCPTHHCWVTRTFGDLNNESEEKRQVKRQPDISGSPVVYFSSPPDPDATGNEGSVLGVFVLRRNA